VDEAYADEALSEIEHRLLGKSEPKTEKARSVWHAVMVYLDGRIHGTPEQKPGRTPDMRADAAAATREVLDELERFTSISRAACEEAGMLLRSNHARVLADIVNPSKELNIDGKPLTQTELKRVAARSKAHADEALCELERRLLGEGSSDPATEAAAEVWATMANYLDARIQSRPDQKPGRTPDMSTAAASATRATLQQMRRAAGRVEAGMRLRGNHARVVRQLVSTFRHAVPLCPCLRCLC
jgi:hypothetical protein